MGMAWSGRLEIMVLAALRVWQLLDRVSGTFLGGTGRLSCQAWCEVIYGRKLSAEAPATAMPAGPSWGRRCGFPPHSTAPGENPRPRGLDDGGVMRRYPLGGVVVEPQLDSVRSNVVASFGFLCSFLFIL
jgi:hypothetical protein